MSETIEADAIAPSWRSWTGAHGGLLAGLVLDHAGRRVPGLAARSLHVSYLSSVRTDTVRVATRLVKAGRSSSTATAELTAEDRVAVLATATFGRSTTGPVLPGPPPPSAPGPDDVPGFDFPGHLVPFAEHLEVRPVGAVPLGGGEVAELVGWARMFDPPARPESAAALLLDALAPGLYAVRTSAVPVPTVDLAVHFAEGAPGFDAREWSLLRIRTEHAAGGWCVDASEVWSRGGELIATGRQARRVVED
ncbi:thioesterase family protein [Actinokineospora sp. PR83]|uniref:thioesterase family protein n=1 Tax=Actinokineospora sp. PR83 TaxID=2884908 RepID=UPI001F2FAE37|nr:thioesterase family protein [Actinokineospora sp. PR83]MCG8918990.1 thioesterase family protein [Actinokineospora sp. PR83]